MTTGDIILHIFYLVDDNLPTFPGFRNRNCIQVNW
jgi:hypothetical protein